MPAVSAARCGSRLSTTQRYLNPVTEDVAGVLAFHARQRDRDPAAPPEVGHRAESLQILFGGAESWPASTRGCGCHESRRYRSLVEETRCILALRRRGDDYDPRPPYWNDLARNT